MPTSLTRSCLGLCLCMFSCCTEPLKVLFTFLNRKASNGLPWKLKLHPHALKHLLEKWYGLLAYDLVVVSLLLLLPGNLFTVLCWLCIIIVHSAQGG